jgi:dTDP-4-dehydrorhamnose reductase
MRILIFGKTGQVATELARNCPAGISCRFLARTDADLADPTQCEAVVLAADADAVINAAAFTAVDAAQTDEQTATIINGQAPGAMARACAQKGIPFLHVSTDYVFDGSGTAPFAPDHTTRPLSAYGRSKLAGEDEIRNSGARHLIMRTSWVFSAHGQNFFKTMQRLGKSRETINVVADQIGGPTAAHDIAKALFIATKSMVDGHKGGTHHFSGQPNTSWADFARAIMKGSGLPCKVRDIPSSDFPSVSNRPPNSRLDCNSLTKLFKISQPDWRQSLREILTEQNGSAPDET